MSIGRRVAIVIGIGFVAVLGLRVAGLAIARSSASLGAAAVTRPDARRLRVGKFEYRDSLKGNVVGQGAITVRQTRNERKETQFVFSAVFKFMSGANFRTQSWESVATPAMAPVFASLTFGAGRASVEQFELKYSAGKVCGEAPVAGVTAGCDLTTDLPADIVDQRVDWAAVTASDLENVRHFEFHVYDPKLGVSAVTADVGGVERVVTPAGAFDAYRVVYRIAKSSGAEKYQVLASKKLPRLLVREEFPNGDVGELVKITSR